MNKKEIRQSMLIKRNAITSAEQAFYSEQIADNVLKSDIYQNSVNICVYQAFRNEVSCDKITECALKDGKKVFVPVTDKESKTMEFYQITTDTEWIEGAYGIREPVLGGSVLKLSDNQSLSKGKTLILMPGLVFDKQKHRIGYGGGYYDKYLSLHTEHITAALCYSFQIIDEDLPFEEHDILPDYIVTEERIF